MTIKEIIEIMVAESVQENSSTNNRVIIEQDFQIVAEEIVKKLNTEDESKCKHEDENLSLLKDNTYKCNVCDEIITR